MQPALQLNHYFFPVTSVIANQSFRPDLAEGKAPPLLNLNVTSTSYDGVVYEVQLDLKINHTDEHPSQYNVELKAIGIFNVDPNLENAQSVVKAVGASILYSASREFLLTIMSRGPWPPIMLNLTSFRPEDMSPLANNTLGTAASPEGEENSKGR